jgi:NAD dependent epimerase/dehydratase family enzyme
VISLAGDTPPGSDYHALGKTAWEYAAMPAVWVGVRTALLRTGIIWGRDDGMAYNQLDQFKRGWGGITGGGINWIPWIHIRWDNLNETDQPQMVMFLAGPDVLSGLFVLANFDEAGSQAVFSPAGSGCACMVQYP